MVVTEDQQRTEHLESKTRQVDNYVRAIFLKLDEVRDEIFQKMDERFDNVDVRLGRVEENVDRIDERLGRVEENVDKINERLERVEKTGKRTEQQVKDLHTTVDLMSFRQSDQASAVTNLADQMVLVRDIIGVHSERFDGQAATLKAHGETMESHGVMLKAHGEQLDGMDGKLDAIVETVGASRSGGS